MSKLLDELKRFGVIKENKPIVYINKDATFTAPPLPPHLKKTVGGFIFGRNLPQNNPNLVSIELTTEAFIQQETNGNCFIISDCDFEYSLQCAGLSQQKIDMVLSYLQNVMFIDESMESTYDIEEEGYVLYEQVGITNSQEFCDYINNHSNLPVEFRVWKGAY